MMLSFALLVILAIVLNFDRSAVITHFRILKMIATSGFLTVLECTKFAPALPQIPLAGLRGSEIQGEGEGRDGEERVGRRPPYPNSWIRF